MGWGGVGWGMLGSAGWGGACWVVQDGVRCTGW